MPDDDWRLDGDTSGLVRRNLRWATWWAPRAGWDHDHCVLCYAEISDQPVDEHTLYNAAWVTDDDYTWICPVCFEDFRTRFDWVVVGEPGRA